MPLLISVHVLPPSCVRQKCGLKSSMRIVFAAAYAVSVSKCPASMLKMRVHGLICGGVTFVHFAPPSVVTWMLPSSVPAHRTLTSLGDGDSAVIDPAGGGRDGRSRTCRRSPERPTSGRARSPLMRVQFLPPSRVLQTAFCA